MTGPIEPDAGIRAQRAAEAHLDACFAAEEEFEEALAAGAPTGHLDSPACAPFDGCTTCEIREVLYAAWPVFTEDAVERLRAAGFADAADLLATDLAATGLSTTDRPATGH